MKKIIPALALSALAASANATTVSLQGPATVLPGQTFEVYVVGNFEEFGLLAGGVRLVYDDGLVSILAYENALSATTEPLLSCPGAPTCPDDPPGQFTMVWTNFIPSVIEPNAGMTVMGVITMSASQNALVGTALALTLEDAGGFTGGWFGSDFSGIATPTLTGATIAVVPLPAAVWLLLGALGALRGLRRH